MKKKPAKKSPRNYRSFTERFKKTLRINTKLIEKLKTEALVFLYTVTIISIIFLSFDLFSNVQRQREISFQKEKIRSEIMVWEGIAGKFKNYKEAYYKLAALNYQIGEVDKAKFYINKALLIDPNFDKAKELEKILSSY